MIIIKWILIYPKCQFICIDSEVFFFNSIILKSLVPYCNTFLACVQNMLQVDFTAHFPLIALHFHTECSLVWPVQVIFCYITLSERICPLLHFMSIPLLFVTIPLLPVSDFLNLCMQKLFQSDLFKDKVNIQNIRHGLGSWY